jgi:hypothetical protein
LNRGKILIFNHKKLRYDAKSTGYAIARHPLTKIARYEVEYTGDSIREILIKNPTAQAAFFELLKQLKK